MCPNIYGKSGVCGSGRCPLGVMTTLSGGRQSPLPHANDHPYLTTVYASCLHLNYLWRYWCGGCWPAEGEGGGRSKINEECEAVGRTVPVCGVRPRLTKYEGHLGSQVEEGKSYALVGNLLFERRVKLA